MSKRRPDMPPFSERDLLDDPIELFGRWFDLAAESLPMAEAMCLATVDGSGAPDARMVLLKGFDHRGFRFFTNESSVKGGQLAGLGSAALIFYWRELDRQIRVRGEVERVDGAEADEYFATRPRESMIGAWASPQSEELGGREELDRKVVEVEARFAGIDVERPPHWGGYRVIPGAIEFWQGQVGRLHDRFRYERSDPSEQWSRSRLAP